MNRYIKNVSFHDRYLLITAHGVRNSSLEVAEGTLEFYRYIEQSKSTNVILDYREVTFNNSLTDAFNLVRFYERMPLLKNVKLAAIINEASLPLAHVWQEFAQVRGFQFHFKLDFESAERWLLQEPSMSV
jgi:hypothetical protein